MAATPALDPSAARAATVELYAAARPAVSMAGMSTAQLVEFVGECEAGARAFEAARTLALARLAATEEVVAEDGTVQEVSQGLGYRRLDAPDLVSESLGLSSGQAGDSVDEAVILAAKLPSLVDAMGAGRIDAYRAGVVAEELREAPRAVCDEVLARIDGSLGKPSTVLRHRTRRALEVVDPESLVKKSKRARSTLGLRMVRNDDSTDTWTAIIPTEQSREAWAAVEPLAKQIRDTDRCTLDVARARAMMQLMLDSCSGTFHVHFAVPADKAEEFAARFTCRSPDPTTPESGDDDPVVVTGLGTSGTTIVPRGWLAEVLDGQHGDVEADVIGCDPVTGGFVTDPIPIATSHGRRPGSMPKLASKAYRPTDACRAYVKARDQRCRFPGCMASAYFTDLDHLRAWPDGSTDPHNLACLCRRHHRIKQRPGWAVRLNPDGSMDWADLTGTVRTTLPARGHATEAMVGGFGDSVWDGDYWNPDAYTGGPALWLHTHLDLAARCRDLEPIAPAPRLLKEEPTAVELRYDNLLLAEHDEDQHRPLRQVDHRDLRWLDRASRRCELANSERYQPEGDDEPPF